MKLFINVFGVLKCEGFFGTDQNIEVSALFVQILASFAKRAVASGEELLARLSSVSVVELSLTLELVGTVSKAAFVSKFASSSKFPVLTHLSLIFSLIVFNELSSFFSSVEFLFLGTDTKGRNLDV